MALQFYVKINGNVHGPLTGQKIQEMAQCGQLSPTDEVRLSTSQSWFQAGNLKGIQFAAAPVAEEPQKPPQEFSDLRVTIPNPPDYPAISFFIGLNNLGGCFGIIVALFGSLIVAEKGHPEFIIPLVIVAFFYAAFCFFCAQLLALSADSARNLHRLTHSNLLIMKSIVNNKK